MPRVDLTAALAAHVRRLRDEREWSQETAAARCGVEVRTLQRVEAGLHAATLRTLEKLAEGFGVDATALLSPAPNLVRRAKTRLRR